MIRIFNTLTGEKEEFRPLNPPQVGMYVCGPTVYDYCHIGHARSMLAFDVIVRYLTWRGYEVRYVRNITDIDDKIIQRALGLVRDRDRIQEQGELAATTDLRQACHELTAKFTDALHEDCDALGMLRPTVEPRATQYIPQMQALIRELLKRDLAYQADNGDIMFAVAKFKDYGKLSGKVLEDLRAGARVEVDANKRDPLDFVLWKSYKPGEPHWGWSDQAAAPGRPGWHIECSAMSRAELGGSFDIHGGGLDLKFPHHENEIAQSCGAGVGDFARLWMHNGFVNIDNEKMSKSLGNFFTIRDVLAELRHPEVLRFFLISSHYRGPINYSLDQLEQADAALNRLYLTMRDSPPAAGASAGEAGSVARAAFIAAMDDDFNTPEALAALQGLARQINVLRDRGEPADAAAAAATLRELGAVLGILQLDPLEWLRRSRPGGEDAKGKSKLTDEQVETRIAERNAARKARDFKRADQLRDELQAAGVILEDRPGGKTQWRYQ